MTRNLHPSVPCCDRCGELPYQPATAWGRTFCTTACKTLFGLEYPKLIRAYAEHGYASA